MCSKSSIRDSAQYTIHVYVSGLHNMILFTFEEDVLESTVSESKNLEN